jgi:hypothetical protein
LAQRPDELEKKDDRQVAVVFDAVRQPTPLLMSERREMGHHTLVQRK